MQARVFFVSIHTVVAYGKTKSPSYEGPSSYKILILLWCRRGDLTVINLPKQTNYLIIIYFFCGSASAFTLLRDPYLCTILVIRKSKEWEVFGTLPCSMKSFNCFVEIFLPLNFYQNEQDLISVHFKES